MMKAHYDILDNPQFKKTKNCDRYTVLLANKEFNKLSVDVVEGKIFKLEYLLQNKGFNRPLSITGNISEFYFKLPNMESFDDVSKEIGGNYPLTLIEVGEQHEIQGYTASDFARYLKLRTEKHKIINMISLEVSNTPLQRLINAPRLIRQIDWIDTIWPLDRRSRGDYPRVQKYCLSGNTWNLL